MVVRSAESVCIGHPDKLCDLIAEHILDDILTRDPTARVAVEVMATGRRIIVTGEITTTIRPQLRHAPRHRRPDQERVRRSPDRKGHQQRRAR
nr:S-adenosylmethionine synthetase N-terminal domain-containing protein [Corynebacterium sp. 76QC2CO]